MSKPDLTVAICTHSNAELLERVLEALAVQRVDAGIRWELLVVDNASTDRTPEVLAAARARGVFQEFRVVREPRLGLSTARRTAIAEARSELIAFIDDDCLLDPDWVSSAVRFALAHPGAGAFGGRVVLDWMSPPTPLVLACGWALAQQDHGSAPRRVHEGGSGSLVGAGLVLRRDALTQSGWIDHGQMTGRVGRRLSAGDDAEISLRIRAAGWELWYDPALSMKHVMPAGRMETGYLARLHRGTGRTVPHIAIIAGERRPGALTRAYFCYRGLAKALGKGLRAGLLLALGRTFAGQLKWMQANYWFGCFEGALALRADRDVPAAAATVRSSRA